MESETEAWSADQRRLFLYAAVPALFLPVSFVVFVAAGTLWGVPVPGAMIIAGLVGTLVQLPIYMVWAWVSPELNVLQKIVWIATLFLANMFAVPLFLYFKYRRQTATGLSTRA